jgi:hypothetical protein
MTVDSPVARRTPKLSWQDSDNDIPDIEGRCVAAYFAPKDGHGEAGQAGAYGRESNLLIRMEDGQVDIRTLMLIMMVFLIWIRIWIILSGKR